MNRLSRRLVLALVAALALLPSGLAAAAVETVTFDDLAAGTTVFEQYKDSHGLRFPGQAAGDGIKPVVRTAIGVASSGDRVADWATCVAVPPLSYAVSCAEGFFIPRTRGRLSATTASAVSVHVGYLASGGNLSAQAKLTIRDASGTALAVTPFQTIVRGGAGQKLELGSSSANIASFDLDAGPGDTSQPLTIDDVAITYPDMPVPPDFSLSQGQGIVDVLLGTAVEVPVELGRVNGSNGDISFAAGGLPTGMSASFNPNPATGAAAGTTLTLTAADTAAPSDQYTDVTITATPSGPGTGPAPRSIVKKVRIRENCARTVRFPYVDARTSKCLVKSGSTYEATNAEVRVNGLIIKPADDSRPTLVIDSEAKTIKGKSLTMPFTVSIDSGVDIPIYAGPISWKFAGDSGGPHKIVTGLHPKLFKKLKGLPITGIETAFLPNGATQFTTSLKLGFWPFNYFGAITASTLFVTDNDSGADFTGLDLAIGKVNAVALELRDVQLHWRQGEAGDTWSGSATAVLKFAKPYAISSGLGISNGEFKFLTGSVSGLNIQIGYGIFLQSLGYEVHVNPLVLVGSAGISAGPSVAGVQAINVNGALKAVFADPFVVEVSGNVKVANKFDLGGVFMRYSSTGLFEFGATSNLDFWLLKLNGGVQGWVDGLDAFNVEGPLNACLLIWGPDPCGRAKLVLSSKGVGGCVGVYGHYVGAGTKWSPFDPDAFTGCDLGPFSAAPPARSAGSGTSRFTLPKGLPSVAWEVTGDGSVPGPGVTVTGPGGATVTVSRDVPLVEEGRFRAELRDDGTTFVFVNRPAAGAWTLTGDGSVPVQRVREARGLPQASASASVTGSGRSRVLRWKLRRIAGQRVTFAEIGKDVRNAIVTNTTSGGSVRFRPADGPVGKRTIVALVEQNGLPRTTLTVGSYRAPGMAKPGRPRALRIRRSGARLVVSWRPRPAGFRHAVYLELSDGRRLVRVVGAKRRSVMVKAATNVAAKVKVFGLTAGNGKGPAARASIKRAPKGKR